MDFFEANTILNQAEVLDVETMELLVRVEALGPGVCHNGYQSCFYRRFENGQWVESENRTYDPNSVYGSKG